MFFTGLDISATNSYDAVYIAQDKRKNPVLLKKVTSPVNMKITDTIIQEDGSTINFIYKSEITSFSSIPKVLDTEDELTKMCMHVSEMSLKEGWENEDDAYWESFIKN